MKLELGSREVHDLVKAALDLKTLRGIQSDLLEIAMGESE